jgi:hypothetical protein
MDDLDAVADRLLAVAGRPVTYRRGNDTWQIRAVRGRSAYVLQDAHGTIHRYWATDYIIRAHAIPMPPDVGDQIIDGPDTHTVVATPDDGPYRHTGPLWRIHTRSNPPV